GQQQGTAQILPYRPGVDPEPVAWAGPAILTGEQPTATLLGFGITVPGDWRWIWHWHHNLPQEIFTPDFLKARGLKININSPRWGYMLQGIDHIGKGGLHLEGWNQAWLDWIKLQDEKGIPITEQSIAEQLEEMRGSNKFKKFFDRGMKATEGYLE